MLAPGSRPNEIAHLVPALFGAAARLARAHPDWQLAVPLAPRVAEEPIRRAARRAGIEIVTTRGDIFDLFAAADFGIVCSGTATLEAALAGLPMVIVYRGNWLNLFLARRLIRIDRIGLPNIVLGGERCSFPGADPGRRRARAARGTRRRAAARRGGARGAARRLRARGAAPCRGADEPCDRGGSAAAREERGRAPARRRCRSALTSPGASTP